MISDFRKALNQVGLTTREEIIADGKLRRFHVDGDRAGKKNGWYVLYGDSLPAGVFGSWKRQITETWCLKTDRQMTAAERAEFKRRMTEARATREAEEQERRKAAREKAFYIWKTSQPASDDHPYLVRKCVKSYGLRVYKGLLVIPLHDSGGKLHSLQFIDKDGDKRFLSGGKIQGCYFPIGTPADTICICEGYATSATVYEASGHAVAVAFNAGNLHEVAKAIRIKFPEIRITVCADNDTQTEGNPGLRKAQQAAAAVAGLLAVPGKIDA